jgi:hypothetical protein
MTIIKYLVFIILGIGAPMAFLDLLSIHFAMAGTPMRTPDHVWLAIAISWALVHIFIIGFALWGVNLLWQCNVSSSRKALIARMGLGACVLMAAYSLLLYAIASW